jgi:hypothetical protein
MATVVNRRVRPHFDRNDAADGWAAMTAVGRPDKDGKAVPWTGGDLVLPQFKLRFQYLQGDVVFFRSRIVEHSIQPFEGDRTALVMFTHEKDLSEDVRTAGDKNWKKGGTGAGEDEEDEEEDEEEVDAEVDVEVGADKQVDGIRPRKKKRKRTSKKPKIRLSKSRRMEAAKQ